MSAVPEIGVYSGRDCLGHVLERDGKAEAFDADGASLGTFPTRRKATTAIHEAAQRGERGAA